MISREEFARDIAAEAAKDAGESAVFIIEIGDGVDEILIQQAEEILLELVGERRLKSFRVR